MNFTMAVDSAFNDHAHSIRIDDKTKMASVVDVIRMVNGSERSDALKSLTRLLAINRATRPMNCPKIKINGSGRETPVADATTLVEIIWELPGKAAKEFRRGSAHYVCRMLGADLTLAREIEQRHSTASQQVKDFFAPVSAAAEPTNAAPQPEHVQTAIVVHKRPCVKIYDVEFEMPGEFDSEATQQFLNDRLRAAMALQFDEVKTIAEKRVALTIQKMEDEQKRSGMLKTQEMEEETKRRQIIAKREMEETERRMVVANREMAEDAEHRMVLARQVHKRTLHEIAIENCELVTKRTKAVYQVLTALKDHELIHPSLMTAAIGSISNMAADAAGVGQMLDTNGPSHLEDFSTMCQTLCRTIPDLTHLSAIGKLVATEYRTRNGGKNPERVTKQVNGAMRPINVYETKEREWIEDIVRKYINNIPKKTTA